MQIHALNDGWTATRAALQHYAHAVTAFPRAGTAADPRWSHVAMDLSPKGLTAAPTPLADGSSLTSEIDLVDHAIVTAAGDDVISFDLTAGPSPVEVGNAIKKLVADHGGGFEVDDARFDEDSPQPYDTDQAERFRLSAAAATAAFQKINDTLTGEIAGPHLWPHGFDIATEWFSPKTVDYNGEPASAQIALGWYPTSDGYVYMNPWPFEDEWASAGLPAGAAWHLDGWQGAKLDVPPGGVAVSDVVELGIAVHALASEHLTS